ncbi:helix-turn-helix domain-containing protein [Silvibacterium sp.]|uniref:helix-turn-helix domain-containing protein n=1 Tax=Silvibacterium sp. TaxID=1964179 RepID=UPI0039E62D53
MPRRKANSGQTSFALASPLQGHDSSALANAQNRDAAHRSPAMTVRRLQAGERFTIPAGCASVLVQTAASTSAAAWITTAKNGEAKPLSHAGEVLSANEHALVEAASPAEGGVLLYILPRASFRSFASHHAPPRLPASIDAFEIPDPVVDAYLHLLSRSIYPLLVDQADWSQGFAGYFALSLYFHLLNRYGIEGRAPQRSVGGLSPRNRSLVERALHTAQGVKISIETLSAECSLSSRQFARAFQQSFGMPFYKFQLDLRIQRAKQLLMESETPLGAIALHLGYADQATFTESFAKITGIPPGRFRRRHQPAQAAMALSMKDEQKRKDRLQAQAIR